MICSQCSSAREIGRRLCPACLSAKRSARISQRLVSDPVFREKRNAYKAGQRRKAAQVIGKVFVSRDAEYHASIVQRRIQADAAKQAARLEREQAPKPLTSTERYRIDAAFRESEKAKAREQYRRSHSYQLSKVQRYKLEHPERKAEWDATRDLRIESSADGTVTASAIKDLKSAAIECAYCRSEFAVSGQRKVTDHVKPLCRDGAHSLANIVICCEPCNLAKGNLTLPEWIDRRRAA